MAEASSFRWLVRMNSGTVLKVPFADWMKAAAGACIMPLLLLLSASRIFLGNEPQPISVSCPAPQPSLPDLSSLRHSAAEEPCEASPSPSSRAWPSARRSPPAGRRPIRKPEKEEAAHRISGSAELPRPPPPPLLRLHLRRQVRDTHGNPKRRAERPRIFRPFDPEMFHEEFVHLRLMLPRFDPRVPFDRFHFPNGLKEWIRLAPPPED